MVTPIYKSILNYVSRNVTRLHMPGHKGQDVYNIKNLWKYDVSEIKGLDNLLYSNGVIKETEDLYSGVYNSKASVITTQGSTLGVQMMITSAIMSLKCKSKKIIIDRNVHISAVNVMALLDIEPIWIYHDELINDFMPGLISAKNLEKTLIDNPDVHIVYITSPNYFGLMMDLKSISAVCKKYDCLLLVDNAHGAHLKFIDDGLHPMDCGCSCCCDSLHKTLPVLTGGGLVHILDERLIDNIKRAQRLYSSTSPSYLIMLSIDVLLTYINDKLRPELKILSNKIKELKILSNNLGFDIPNGNIDPMKLVIGKGFFDCNIKQILEIFRKYNIEPEYINDYWLLFMFSTQNRDIDFYRVEKALKKINKTFNRLSEHLTINNIRKNNSLCLKQGLSIREAIFSKYKTIKTINSLGEIAIDVITVCPPCVPIIMPGEVISREVIEILLSHNIKFLKVKN